MALYFGVGCSHRADYRSEERPFSPALQMAYEEFCGPYEKGVGRHVEHDLTAPECEFRRADQQQRHGQRGGRVQPMPRQAKGPPSEKEQKGEFGQQRGRFGDAQDRINSRQYAIK
jgi:hypothetical protein